MLEKLVIADTSSIVREALEREFQAQERVVVTDRDILRCKCEAVVSPANSFGDMGGGLDKHLDDYTKGRAQDVVTERIRNEHFGELPVGIALVIPIGLRRLRNLVVAPTMRVPGNVSDSLNAYLAMRAALVAVARFNSSAEEQIRSLAISGLCTGVGRMLPEVSARQMRAAFHSVAQHGWREVVHPAMAPFATH